MLHPKIYWKQIGQQMPNFTSTAGRQGVFDSTMTNGKGLTMFTRSDLRAIYNKLMYDANLGAPKASIGTGHPGLGDISLINGFQPPSLEILSAKREFTLNNKLNMVAYFEMWELVSLENQEVRPPKGMWEAELIKATPDATSNGIYGLNALYRNTIAPLVDDTLDITDPGLRPFKNMRNFFKNWKVIRKTKFKLEPGTSVIHNCYTPAFSIANNTLYDPDDPASGYIQDVTKAWMCICIGEKCYDNTAGIQPMSYAPTSINMKYEDSFVFRIKPRGRRSFNFITNTPDQFANETFDANGYQFPVAALPAIGGPALTRPRETIPHDMEGVEDSTTATTSADVGHV